MLAALRRLRSLALWVVACVALGPSASALCPDGEAAEVPPCHDAAGTMGGVPMMGDMPMERSAPDGPMGHGDHETACLSACCAVAGDAVALVVVVPSAPLAAVVARAPRAEVAAVRAAPATAARAHPPPGPTLLDTGRLRI